MRVSVEIQAVDGSIDIVRTPVTERTMLDGPDVDYRHAADVLETIAADLRRMYPAPEPTYADANSLDPEKAARAAQAIEKAASRFGRRR